MNIFITGHRGYIGTALVKHIRKLSIINKLTGFDIKDGHDILNYKSLLREMDKNCPDVVIHLASIRSSSISEMIRINAIGTNNVLKAMHQVDCNNIIYASTCDVYDKNCKKFTETTRIEPFTDFGISKLLGENCIFSHYTNTFKGSYLIFRLFNVVGDNDVFANDKDLFSQLDTGTIIIYGDDHPTVDGTCERDFISIRDVCAAFIKGIYLVISYKKLRETVNICSGVSYSIRMIIVIWNIYSDYCALLRQRGNNLTDELPYLTRINYSFTNRRNNDIAIIAGSNAKAEQLLKWKPEYKLSDIIESLITRI